MLVGAKNFFSVFYKGGEKKGGKGIFGSVAMRMAGSFGRAAVAGSVRLQLLAGLF